MMLAMGLAITARQVSKAFPGIQALSEVDFALQEGEIHGLVGGNGAGKSTLIKVLSGIIKPDFGTIETKIGVDGKRDITTVHQELTIVPEMSAVSNVFLGAPPGRFGFLNRQSMEDQFRRVSHRLGARISPNVRSGSLSVADQQLLEIMRALILQRSVIIMDEPTAALGEAERQNLFRVARELRRDGTAIVYIAHNLEKVLLLCDRISVMRNGRLIETRVSTFWTKSDLLQAMLGYQPRWSAKAESERVGEQLALSVRDLRVTRDGPSVSFDLKKGEVLGIAGLIGSGRSEILEALAGARPANAGQSSVGGQVKPPPKSVRAALADGIALAPEDRKRTGLVLTLSGHRNIHFTNAARSQRLGFVMHEAAAAVSTAAACSVGLPPDRLHVAAATLSGGNQQKLVIGKWLPARPNVLLLDEPPRGVDIGAKAELFRTIRNLCKQGM